MDKFQTKYFSTKKSLLFWAKEENREFPKVRYRIFSMVLALKIFKNKSHSGVELALEKMKKNEQAQISIIPKLAQGGTGVPQVIDSSIVYDINLKTFERAKESWQLDGEQKLEQACIFKDKGTDFFKQGKYELAANKYKKIIDFLEHEISLKVRTYLQLQIP